MKYFLDTNICIYFLKGTHSSVKNLLMEKHPDDIRICSIVRAELLYGAEKSAKQKENLRIVEDFLLPFSIVPFGEKESTAYAKIRARLEKTGSPIGPNDLLIAATVQAHEGCLVSNNLHEFSRIEGLRIENWVANSG